MPGLQREDGEEPVQNPLEGHGSYSSAIHANSGRLAADMVDIHRRMVRSREFAGDRRSATFRPGADRTLVLEKVKAAQEVQNYELKRPLSEEALPPESFQRRPNARPSSRRIMMWVG